MAVYAMNPNERRRKQRALSNTGQQQTQGQYGRSGAQPAGGYGTGFIPPDSPGGNVAMPEGGYGTGFVPQGQTQQQYGQPQQQPNFSHQQMAGPYQQSGPNVDTRHNVRMFQGQVVGGGQPQPQRAPRPAQRRYGQQQGFGQGYIAPRRSLGDQHRTAPQRTAASAGRGYNPRTSANLYGGRPRGNPRPQMNQMQAMTQNARPASTYIKRPYGGTSAVNRQR